MGKRANIRATAKATQTMVWQNRAAHLRAQGVLGPAAGPGEAQAHDRQAAVDAWKARVAEHGAKPGRHTALWCGLVMVAAALGLWALSPMLGFFAGLIAVALLVTWSLSAGLDALFARRDRRSAPSR